MKNWWKNFLVRKHQPTIDESLFCQAADQLFALGQQYRWWKPSALHWRDFEPTDRAEFLAAAASIVRASGLLHKEMG